MRTQVAVVGGGPAGALLAHLLGRAGIDSMVLEGRSRDYVLGRIRAGVLERGSVETLVGSGLGDRLLREGQVHHGVNLAFADRLLRIDFRQRLGRSVTVYGQTEVQKDLYEALSESQILFEAGVIEMRDIATEHPSLTFRQNESENRLDCDFVAGCDGSHGISRSALPAEMVRTYERHYPFGWVGVMADTPPVSDELIYAHHPRGFALCSMRSATRSRYYVQCPDTDDVADWSDERFWEELASRLPSLARDRLVTGPSIEKSITPLRSFVTEPMRVGRLFLAGDAAHVVPPTGAKGLNLAIADVNLLAQAFVAYYRRGDSTLLDTYSDRALRRTWKAVRFSWWLTDLMHRLDEENELASKLQEAELEFLEASQAAQTAFAENYTGLPLT